MVVSGSACAHASSTSVSTEASTSANTVNSDEIVSEAPNCFDDLYEVTEHMLGEGASGVVREAVCRATGRKVAVKIYDKSSMKPKDLKYLASELAVLADLEEHQNIVKCEGVFESDTAVRVVMEKLEGGELFEHICKRKRIPETEAADIMTQTLRALAHLHTQNVMHRDIKPENLVFIKKGGRWVQLIDFGFATKVNGKATSTKCGTIGYAAPEIFAGGIYDEKCDMWSLGCLLYFMLTGQPLIGGSDEELMRKSRSGKVEFGREFWCLSEDAQALLRALVEINPAKRPSASEALAHPWLLRMTTKANPTLLPLMSRGNRSPECELKRAGSPPEAAAAGGYPKAKLTLLPLVPRDHRLAGLELKRSISPPPVAATEGCTEA